MFRNRAPRRVATVALAVILVASAAVAQSAQVAELRASIAREFPEVRFISTAELARRLASRTDRPLLLDARAPAEYAVSHLRSAIRIDPLRPDVEGIRRRNPASVVVYCSVGYRSASVARRLLRAGLRDVRNLEGGIFGWANEGRPVFRGDRPVLEVHPFDASWGRYLRPSLRSSLPR